MGVFENMTDITDPIQKVGDMYHYRKCLTPKAKLLNSLERIAS